MKQIINNQSNIKFYTKVKALLLTSVVLLAYGIFNLGLSGLNQAQAAIPKYVNFQGKLTKVSDGTNMTNGTYAFEFKLYAASSGGSALWTETYDQPSGSCGKLAVTNGVFNAKLGTCNSLSGVDFTTGSLYLSVNFAPTGTSYDGEMSPRKQMMASAFAFVANGVSGDGKVNTENQSSDALTVGRVAATPALQVDTNTGSSVTGLKVTAAASGGGLALTTISSGTNENLTIDAKGSGTISIGSSSTGDILLAGGSGSTGCTVANSSGNLTCTGNILGASTGTAGYWTRSGTLLSPATAGDDISLPTGDFIGLSASTARLVFNDAARDNVTLTDGDLLFSSDNTWDIGASGATRARTIYAGTSLVAPLLTNAAALSITTTASNGNISLTPNGTGSVLIPAGTDFGSGTNAYIEFQTAGNNVTFTLDGGQALNLVNASTNGMNAYFSGRNITRTSGTSSTIEINPTFAPTSGTGVYNSLDVLPVINQTSTASGISRGILVDPTLTSSKDFRGIETAYTIAGALSGSSNYGSKIAITNNQTTNANTVYGQHISFTDAGSLANTVTGLYIDATTANSSDTTYAGIFQGGNVGIGDTSPSSLFTVGSGDLFQINSSGQIGSQQAPVSDYLFALAGTTGNDNSRIIDITQANDTNEDSSVINISNTINLGSVDSVIRQVNDINSTITPTSTVTSSSGTASFVATGSNQSVVLGSTTIGTSSANTSVVTGQGVRGSVTNNPIINDSNAGGTVFAQGIGVLGLVGGAPTYTNVSSATTILNYGGYFATNASSAGNANVNTTSYGSYNESIGNLTTTGTTIHYGGYFIAGGTADTNYGIYSTVSGATTNYAAVLTGGNVGIGTTAPDKALEINSSTGANLRLTYNDNNGTATNYADLSTTSSGDLTVAPSGGDVGITGVLSVSSILQVGSATPTTYSRLGTGTTGHTLGAADDLLISDDLEVDGDAFFDGNLTVTGTCTGCGGGLTVGTTAITSGGTNRVLFENGSNVLSESSNFTYDGTTLGVVNSSTTASNKSLNISQTGATSGTDYAGYFSNTGAATTNIGLYATATGATNNYAAIFDGGNVGIGTTSPTIKLQVDQTDNLGAYAHSLGTSTNTTSVVSSNITTQTANNYGGFLADTTVSLSSATGAYTMAGLNGIMTIKSSDSATYAAGSYSTAGAYTNAYLGTGSIPDTRGLSVLNFRNGTGTITNMDGINISQANFSGSGTISRMAGVYLAQPAGAGGATVTNSYGVYVENQAPTAGTLTNTAYGIYQAGTTNYNYFAGNVGIGDASPNSLFTVGSGDLFQVNSAGQIGSQQAPVSDYLFALAGTTGNDNSRIIDITQANDSAEDSNVINIVNTINVGTISTGITRNISNISAQLTPTASLVATSASPTLYTTSSYNELTFSNVTVGNTSTGNTATYAGTASNSNVIFNPIINDGSVGGTNNVTGSAVQGVISGTPTLTSGDANFSAIGGGFYNSTTYSGANWYTSYGVSAGASGNLTGGAHYGGFYYATGTAWVNYGIYTTVSGATNNYAAVLMGGNVGIGTETPTSILHVQQSADNSGTTNPIAFDVNSVGAAGELTASSGTQTFARIAPTVNQTSTAGYTALLINSTQTATGSGSKLLLDAQVGGSSQFSVSSTGSLTVASLTSGGTQCVQASSTGVISGTGTACGSGGGLTVGTTAITSGGANRVLFENGSNVLSESANFTYDGTTLAVATASTTAANKAINISQTGATSGTDYAGYFSNTGSATTNVGLYATATGATNNYAAIFDAGNVGIGTTAPTNLLQVGSLTTASNAITGFNSSISGSSATSNFLNITGTVPTTLSADTNAVFIDITGNNQNSAMAALRIDGPASTSGSSSGTYGIRVTMKSGTGNSNTAIHGIAGENGNGIGVTGQSGSGTLRVGVQGIGNCSNGCTQVYGTVGYAISGTSNVGGWFGLTSSYPSSSLNAALVADNGTASQPILLLKDNGSTVVSVIDGGNVGIGDASPSALLTVGSGDLFQVNSSGAIAAATGITSSGTITLSGLGGGGTKCVQTDNAGVITAAASACGSGGGLTVGTTAITSGGTNRVLFENGSNVLSENANFTYDGTTLGVVNSSTTASNKSLNISQTGATSGTDYAGYFSNTGAATTNIGLYATATGATNNYAAIFDAGNVGIGDTTPNSLFTVGSGDLFQINSSGQIGSQQAPVSDYLFALNGTTGNDHSRIIDIVQNDDANENTSAINIVSSVNPGTISSGFLTISGINNYIQPTATITGSSGVNGYSGYGNNATVDLNSTTIGTNTGGTAYLYTATSINNLDFGVTINDSNAGGTISATGSGEVGLVYGAPNFTSVSSAATINTHGGYFSNQVASGGDANVNLTAYGVYGETTGNLTTTGTTAHYGGYFSASGTADTNYGIYASVSGATTNYAGIFTGGNVGIGTATPQATLSVAGDAIFGQDDNTASPLSATINGASVLSGTTNTAGATLSVAGGKGTGSASGGYLQLQVAYPSSSGSSVNSLTSVATFLGDNNNSSGIQNLISLTPVAQQTSTAGYNGLLLNVTETSTGSGMNRLADLQVGGSTKFAVRNDGSLTLQDTAYITTPYGGFGKFQNLLVRSEEFDNGSWIKTSVSAPTADAQVAPDGSSTAESLATSGSGGDVCQWSATAAGSNTFTFSVWVKAASGTQNFGLRIDAGATSCATANNVTGTEQTYTATTSWQRYEVTKTFSSATGNVKVRIFPGTTGSTGTVYAWGAQLDQASKATNYAYTAGSTLSNINYGRTTESNVAATASSTFTYGARNIMKVATGNDIDATYVADFIRVIDNDCSTDCDNTTKGLEVQAYSGTNLAGTNIGIDAYGYTFGVKATTTGQASNVAQPAAVFADLDNGSATTTGNAIRAYTDNATSADLVSLYQETSTYTGNGLELNFGNGGGSFTGNFISLQKGGTESFHVDDDGSTFVSFTGTGTGNAVCHATNGNANNDELVDCSSTPSADFAEMYPVDTGIEVGDIVVTGTQMVNTYDATSRGSVNWNVVKGQIAKLKKSTKGYQENVVGVVSDNYHDFTSTGYNIKPQDNPKSIALKGRVLVKITNENGSIKAGDYITASATLPGFGAKATRSGQVVGRALADFDFSSGETGLVMVFMQVGYQSIGNTIVLDAPTVNGTNLQSGEEDLTSNNASTFVIQQQAAEEDSEAVSNILQLQTGDQNRFMVSSTGATSILSNLNCELDEDACPSVLNVTQGSTELMNIDARGTLALAGTIIIKDDSFAGSVVTDDEGIAEVIFSYHLGTGKPVVQLTVEAQIPVFAQILEFKQDEQGNYTGFVMKTFDMIASPIQAMVHYNVTGKQDGYITLGEVAVPSMYSPGDGYGIIIQDGQAITPDGDGPNDPITPDDLLVIDQNGPQDNGTVNGDTDPPNNE